MNRWRPAPYFPGLFAQWLATIRQATHSSLRRRREVIRLGDGKSDRWSQHCGFCLFSPSKGNNNSLNWYTSKNRTFSSDYHGSITTYSAVWYKTKFGSQNFATKFGSHRAANQYGTSVFCTDFTCKIREYEFGLQNTEIELCQFCHIKYCCQNKAYLFWLANQSRFVVFYALKPSNTSLITKTFILLSSTCGRNTCSSSLPVPVVPKESTRVSTGSQCVPPE